MSYAWQLQKNGSPKTTIEGVVRRLFQLARRCNIDEPEQVKETLAKHPTWKNRTKNSAVTEYNGYLKYIGKTWTPPIYKYETPIPFIPTEQEIDQLIAASSKRMATLLQLLKETGARIGEIVQIEWTDIDFTRKTVSINHPEKGSNSRILPITEKLINLLNTLPKPTNKVFKTTVNSVRTTYDETRKRVATKLSNPRLIKISFHTFRHWKGTMEYHKTKDIMHVKYVLGHKAITSTMIYINIEQALFLTGTDEWTCKTANNIKDATSLIEAGFEYIQEIDGIRLYRKRK